MSLLDVAIRGAENCNIGIIHPESKKLLAILTADMRH
jgi:hypothetical protein